MKQNKSFVRSLMIVICLICFWQSPLVLAHPQPIIIDTDVGVDDVIAMMYLLKRTDVDVKAITIASTGNAHCLPALKNTVSLLQLLQYHKVPVECGRLQPLSGNHHFPENILAQSDNLTGLAETLPSVNAKTDYSAVDLLIKTIKASRQPVKIIAIGPLTNIAEALLKAPEIEDHIQAIYIMGGAVKVPGNLVEAGLKTNNRSAEWNIYIDPLAAKVVLSEQIPIILVPLDVTNSLPIDTNFYQSVKQLHAGKAGNFLYDILRRNLAFLKSKQWSFWDPLAAVIATDETVATYEYIPVNVLTKPELNSGQTLIDAQQGQMLKVAVGVNQKQFKRLLLNSINKE
jgi:pyrimidine-specific ribonucleoside hydrolase